MTPGQCRAARAYLQMTQRQLARLSGVSAGTIRNFEACAVSPQRSVLRAISDALEDEGVVWIDGDAPGVQFEGPADDTGEGTVH